MNKRERVLAAAKGEKVDRPPVSAWQHFPKQDTTAEGQVKAFLDFQRKYDWDFMKLMFRSTFLLEGWGNTYSEYQVPLGYWIADHYGVNTPEDWAKLEVLDPTQGAMGEMLQVVRDVKEAMDEDLLILGTVFVPLMVARQLSGDRLLYDIQHHPQQVHGALEVITQTLIQFSTALLENGCDGMFYASQKVKQGYLSAEEYRQFGHPYNLRVLEAFNPQSQFTMMHLCGEDILFDEFLDYPVHAYNWDDRSANNLSLAEARAKTDKCLIGGSDLNGTLRSGSPQEVMAEAQEAIKAVGPEGFILAPGCGITIDTPDENLNALRQTVA